MKPESFLYHVVFMILLVLLPLNTKASQLLDSIIVGTRPTDLVISLDGSKLYVTNIGDDTVSVVNLETNSVIKTISMTPGGDPHHIEISPDGTEVYVSERLSGKVKVISTITDTVVATISTYSGLLNDLKVTHDGKKIYALSANGRGSIRLTIIDVATRVATSFISTTDPQDRVAFSPDDSKAYVQLVVNNSNPLKMYTQVIDVTTEQVLGTVQDTSVEIFSEDGSVGWGRNYGNNTVTKADLSTNAIINATEVNESPNAITSNGEKQIFVTSDVIGTITIINPESMEIVEVIEATNSTPVGIAFDKERARLYIANLDVVDVIQLDSIDEEKDVYELLQELLEAIEEYEFENAIENSYMANLKKVEDFLNAAQYISAENQLRAFIKKVEQDYKVGKIGEEQYEDLIERAGAILELVPEDAFGTVPLITQITSPHPSLEETTTWANTTYAGGRANKPGDCGLTIAQCGCAITSLSMVGRYHGIGSGIDGTSVNPLNMNNWLLSNSGYTNDGSVMWNHALAYMGEMRNGKVMSKLSLNAHSITDGNTISEFVENGSPTLGFSAAKGHYFVLSGTTGDGGYSVRDPLWYNTETTNDTRNVPGKVQDYDNVVTKAHLISYSPAAKPLPESVEILIESPTELLVTDEHGRRLGYDSESGMFVNEIPGGSYVRDEFIASQGNPGENPHKAKRLVLMKPEGETFDLNVIGIGEGSYNLTFAVTDGEGNLFSERVSGETTAGEVHGYTVTTLMGDEGLPVYLQDILDLIPLSDQEKFVQAFRVINDQVEKEHVAVTRTLIENLIRYTESKYDKTVWGSTVVAALRELL